MQCSLEKMCNMCIKFLTEQVKHGSVYSQDKAVPQNSITLQEQRNDTSRCKSQVQIGHMWLHGQSDPKERSSGA